MKKEEFKIIFKKTILFVIVTILILFIYYKIFPIVYRYGVQAFYVKDFLKTDVFKNQFKAEIEVLENSLEYGITFNANSFNFIEDSESLQNKNSENYEISESSFPFYNRIDTNLEYIIDIEFKDGSQTTLGNTSTSIDDFLKYKVYYSCSLNELPVTNLDNLTYYKFHADQEKFEKLDVYVGLNNLDNPDYLNNMKKEYESFNNYIVQWIIFILICLGSSIGLLVNLCKNLKENSKIYFKRFYVEENILIICIALLVSYNLLFDQNSLIFQWFEKNKWLIYLLTYFCIFEAILSLAYSIKFRGIKRNIIFIKILKNKKRLSISLTLCIAITLLVVIYFIRNQTLDVLIVNLLTIIYMLYIMKMQIELIEINENVNQMLEGNYNTFFEKRTRKYEELETNLSNIQTSIKATVNEKLKSEKLKTDLITNVSHDLKTPLTSIINYVKLLKKEKIKNEKAEKYIEILERKANKLKDLTEDLIEVSKLSSGNETVNLEKLNFAEMVRQANGEFAEKFEEKNLSLVSSIQEDKMIVELDSKKMWRALQNLYQNVYKYSLENTRVYVSLNWEEYDKQKERKKLEFEIKNTSKEALNISPEELMERFVRGDKSRNTSGNGLGLSICRDFVELHKGKFEIKIMADLFIARIEI